MKKKMLLCAALIAATASAGSGTHTVVKKDNLWNLSGQYLGNPFYWPQIWSVNPQVKNPHLIYPGDQLLIPTLSDSAAVKGLEGGVGSAITGVDSVVTSEQVAEQLNYYYLNRSDLYSVSTLRTLPYLESENDREMYLGKIADKSRQIFGLNSTVMVSLEKGKSLKVGDSVDFIKSAKKVKHQGDRSNLAIPAGAAVVTKVIGDSATVRVTEGWNTISDGDYIVPTRQFEKYSKPSVDIAVAACETKSIVRPESGESVKPFQTMIIEGGKDRDIRVGDLFVATGVGKKKKVDHEPTFRCIVLRVNGSSSTVLIEEVRHLSSTDSFVMNRVARLNFAE